MLALNILDECRNVDVDGATLHAGRLGTVEAAMRLAHSHILCQALVDLLQARLGTILGVEFGHYDALDGLALFGVHGLAELGAPRSVTVG